MRPSGPACSTKPRRNYASSEWDVSRMLIVMSVKRTLTDELLKVNSALKYINILCDGRSVQCRTMKFEVRNTALQNKLTLPW